MATTPVTTRAYPKRKRAEISYHESSSGEGEEDDEYGTSDEVLVTTTTRKKPKSSGSTISTKPLPKRKIFPFTSLPAELKNQIYALALTDPCVINFGSRTKHYRRTVYRYGRSSLTPNILLLNRAIYAETQPILYADNTFSLADTTTMHAFLAMIGHKNRATLTELNLQRWVHIRSLKAFNHAAFSMLADAVNLKCLNLDCEMTWGQPKNIARQLYIDGFHWLEAVGAAKGKVDAAIDIIVISQGNVDSWFEQMHGGLGSQERIEEFKAELRKMLR